MASPTEISVNQLARLIGTPDCPRIIDVRLDDDFAADPRTIPGAIRHPHTGIAELAPQLRDKKVIVSCAKGLKLSQGSVAILRDMGIVAESLEGGHVAWEKAKQALVPTTKIPPRNGDGRTVWVTRQRPKIDRIACPWLIRRFIDPNAQFLFVAPSQVENVAQHFDATPFDIEGAFWSHRGNHCSFDTMLAEFGLQNPALDRLATIVRGADTNQHDLAPESAGLLAASLGLSRMYRDDLEQLDAGMALYDAFYRWSRDATDEGHDWPATAVKP
ncbi:MAG: rhodanese-related sulfurtransferase [Paracoccaceae bacterium]|jgi:rhodanese-related sulfurtransferase